MLPFSRHRSSLENLPTTKQKYITFMKVDVFPKAGLLTTDKIPNLVSIFCISPSYLCIHFDNAEHRIGQIGGASLGGTNCF